jgi:Transposase, Mutator family
VTVPSTLDAAGWLLNHLDGDDGDQDLARAMLQAFAEALTSAEASMQCQAAYGERSEERRNSPKRLSRPPLGQRVGTIDLKVPNLREGSYIPAWLLVHRRRAEQALASVVAQGLAGNAALADGDRQTLTEAALARARYAGVGIIDRETLPLLDVHAEAVSLSSRPARAATSLTSAATYALDATRVLWPAR